MGYIYTKSGKLAKRLYFGAVLLFEGLYYTFKNRVLADGGTFVENELPTISQDASLVLTPNAYKSGKLYSAVPNDGTGDFTVDRNSTATYIDKDGLIKTALANVPRIDWSTGEAALLVEPQSTNLITYSEDFNHTSWSKLNGTIVTPNNAISPNGLMNATLIEFQNIGGNSYIFNITNVGDVDKVLSFGFWFKKVLGEGSLGIQNSTGQAGVMNLDMSLLSSDWEYITPSHYALTIISQFNSGSSSNAGIFLRTIGFQSKFYLWGAQLEQASTASSYIPTNGAIVTRLADDISAPTPAGVTSITETKNGVEQTPITTIPATYSLPVGNINKVTML